MIEKWKFDSQVIVHIAQSISYSMDTEISPPYPKSWNAGIFEKVVSEGRGEHDWV